MSGTGTNSSSGAALEAFFCSAARGCERGFRVRWLWGRRGTRGSHCQRWAFLELSGLVLFLQSRILVSVLIQHVFISSSLEALARGREMDVVGLAWQSGGQTWRFSLPPGGKWKPEELSTATVAALALLQGHWDQGICQRSSNSCKCYLKHD